MKTVWLVVSFLSPVLVWGGFLFLSTRRAHRRWFVKYGLGIAGVGLLASLLLIRVYPGLFVVNLLTALMAWNIRATAVDYPD